MRSRGKRVKENNKKNNAIMKIIVTALFLACVAFVINIAPNYIQNRIANKTNLIINNNNVTKSLEKDVKIDSSKNIYLSFEDIKNFFDQDICYDKKYNQIITSSDTKLASIELGKKYMYVNSSKVNTYTSVIEENNTYYLPISSMKDVYNIEVKYSEDSNIITIDSMDREQKMGNCSSNTSIKYKAATLSKNIEHLKKGDSVIIISQKNGWYQVRTNKGNIGYTKDVTNIYTSRENLSMEKQVNGKVSMVWDYFTNNPPKRSGSIPGVNVVSPSFASVVRLGKGELLTRIGNDGQAYISWAHNNDLKVWPIVSNDSWQDTTSEILNDYKLREVLINNIVNLAVTYEWDGVNIDFENIKESDKDMFSQFIIELAPRLKEYQKVLSVDVTAPDGSANWSMCFDRYKLGRIADYLVFMAYDQYGDSSDEAGTTAGADWIEVNLKKFVGKQEGVDKNKLILGMPFFTRLWKETGNNVTSTPVLLRSVNSNIPSGVQKTWNDNVKQYYIEYQSGGATYKMWIEDENSLQAKFDLMKKYELAGAAYWQKDFESSDTWNLVNKNIDI